MNARALILGSSILASGIFAGTLVNASSSTELGGMEAPGRTPVLLELFTSEGCSSCPPADKLLQKLDREQARNAADLIVLSEHVDYWNHGGWVDPYSSPEFSKRQRDYAELLNSDVYTPQLVIDGRREVVGSDRAAIDRAVQDSARTAKMPVAVSVKRDAGELQVHIDVGASAGNRSAAVYLVLAEDQARSHVIRGENAGRELEHVAVVQSLVKVGEVRNGSGMVKDVRAGFPPLSQVGNLRVVVFVQDGASKQVLGVGQYRL